MLPIYNKNLQTATPLPTLTLLLGSWWLQNTRTKHINISTYLHKCICIHGKKTLIQIHRNTALLKLMSRFGCLQTFAPEITCRQDRGTSWTTSITHCCIVIRKEQRLGPAFSPRLTTTGHRTWNFFPGNNVMTDIWKKMSLSNPQQAKQFLRRLNIAKMIEHEKNMTKLCIDCMHVIEWYWMSINKYIIYIYPIWSSPFDSTRDDTMQNTSAATSTSTSTTTVKTISTTTTANRQTSATSANRRNFFNTHAAPSCFWYRYKSFKGTSMLSISSVTTLKAMLNVDLPLRWGTYAVPDYEIVQLGN